MQLKHLSRFSSHRTFRLLHVVQPRLDLICVLRVAISPLFRLSMDAQWQDQADGGHVVPFGALPNLRNALHNEDQSLPGWGIA